MNSSNKFNQQRILITMGDPQGIGPEVIVKALRRLPKSAQSLCAVVGAPKAFQKLNFADKLFFSSKAPIEFIETNWSGSSEKSAGAAAHEALLAAVDFLRADFFQKLVTAPICKERMTKSGFDFPGHTEFLADAFSVQNHAMMLFHKKLRVVLSTIHEPLQKVPKLITSKLICEKLILLTEALRRNFKIKNPRLAVCGLNPHAGENGQIGKEEKLVILPGIQKFQKTQFAKGVRVLGPLPADTLFVRANRGEFDAVLCQYHDQGLIPLKLLDFENGVNMTIGLPFVRTSPDHGTAFDIAGKNLANEQSMLMAIKMALK